MELDIAVSEDPSTSEDGATGGETPASTEKIRLGPGDEKSDETLRRELAVLLFAAREPLAERRMVELLERPSPPRVQSALEELRRELEASPLPVVLRKIAGGWRLLTDPDHADPIVRLREEPRPERISAAALETLAIIAYRQPVSKAEIEAIRGVQVGPVLRS